MLLKLTIMETGPGAASVTTPFLTSQEPLEIQLIITLPLQCWLHILHSTV